MSSKEVLSYALNGIRAIGTASAAELDGHFFSGAEVAILNDGDKPKVYRIVVIPHKREFKII